LPYIKTPIVEDPPTAEPTVEPTAQPPDVPAGVFLETFDGDPAEPTRWNPANWDITSHSRDIENRYEIDPMQAAHGPNCTPPPDSHAISAYEDTVYNCKNHVMTAMNAFGYGMIYLTPNHIVDFSNGEAQISFDVSTLRTSGRDWIDIWVTPFEDNLQLPLQEPIPDGTGEPRNAVNIMMDTNSSIFRTRVTRDFVTEDVPGTDVDYIGYESFLVPDARRRDTFVLTISDTHIKFGMPDYEHWWVDADIASLGWDRGVVQLGHHSYNPTKDCGECGPNTWHWDNVLIDPAVPFTMIKADRRYVDDSSGTNSVNLAVPAPANAHLRFAGIGYDLEVSFNDGGTWQSAQLQAHNPALLAVDHFKSYWMPIPKGVERVRFRGNDGGGVVWHVRDIAVWSLESQ
jgi:hypothetical protein